MKINILGEMYEVVEVDEIDNDAHLAGQILHFKNIIQIKKNMHPEKKRVVLLHEVIHGIFEKLGMDKECNDEHLVQVLATSINQLLKDNEIQPPIYGRCSQCHAEIKDADDNYCWRCGTILR